VPHLPGVRSLLSSTLAADPFILTMRLALFVFFLPEIFVSLLFSRAVEPSQPQNIAREPKSKILPIVRTV